MTFQILVVSRWIHFASTFVLFGSSLFWFYTGSERASENRDGLPRTLRATVLMLRVAAPVAAISGLAWIAGILANIMGGFGNVFDAETLRLFFFETQFGPVVVLQLILFAAAVAIICLPQRNRTWLVAVLFVAGLIMISQSWLGHAAEGAAGFYGALMIVAYGIHILAAAAWVGGLPPLFLALAEQRHFSPDEARKRTLDIMSRYSAVAIVAVSLIVISGMANASFRVGGSFDKLFWAAYGNVLTAKLVLVALMLGLAYFNRFVAMPRLRMASKGSTASTGMTQIAKLRGSVAVELVLGVFVLGIAAVLGITPPPQ